MVLRVGALCLARRNATAPNVSYTSVTEEGGDLVMHAKLRSLSIEERIRLVEDLWDSIAAEFQALPLSAEQKAELDRRLDAYEADGNPGRPASEAIADIRRKI